MARERKYTISVIVPVYQVEPYLRQCVDSILAQSFHDFELLLIDDGSPDSCGKICDTYVKADNRVRVFHRENGGLSAARNTGLDHMRGAYVAMVDSDDVLISKDYLKSLYEALVNNNAEISLCRYADFPDGNAVPRKSGNPDKTFIRSGEDYALWRNIPENFSSNCAHGKLYSAKLFKSVRYPEGRIFEDIAVQHMLTFPCKRIVFIEANLYGYRVRENGIERGTPLDVRAQDIIYAFQNRMDYYQSAGRPDLADIAEQSMLKWLRRHL